MPTITFQDFRALTVFHSMAEGMEEVQRDNGLDGDEESIAMADCLVNVIAVTGEATIGFVEYPLTVELPIDLLDAAESCLENCLDNSSGFKPDDEEGEDFIFEGQVVIAK